MDALLSDAVLQRAVELQEERDKRLAIMVANGVNGARNIDGRSGGVSTT